MKINRTLPVFGRSRLRGSLQKQKYENYFWGYFMIFPIVAGIGIFSIWPLLQSFYLAFTSWGMFGRYRFTGLENFARILKDPNFLKALKNTFLYTGLSVPVSIAIATFVAVLLNQNIRGKSLYRLLYFLPVVTMRVAVAIVWRWMFNADFGLINFLLKKFFSLQGPRWLTDPSVALYSLVIVSIWSSIGNAMIIILAGLQSISPMFYEAADIDGANGFTKFFRITLPLLSPTLFFVSVTSIIGSLQSFETVYMMIGSSSIAIERTQTVVYLFYRAAFMDMQKGYASAIVLILFFIILLLTVLQFRLQKRWVHYE